MLKHAFSPPPLPLEVLRTDPPENASIINAETLVEQANKMGIKDPSKELIEDIANLYSNGVIVENDEILTRLAKARKKQLGFFSLMRWGLKKDDELARAAVYNLGIAEIRCCSVVTLIVAHVWREELKLLMMQKES